MAIDKNKHLLGVLETHRMKYVENFINKMKARKDEIDKKLAEHYGTKKYQGFKSGSLSKFTATNIKFDLDVVEPFKHDSFDSLAQMYEDVFNFLHNEYKDEADEVRRQKVSIGIIFPIEDGDDLQVAIDVVPGRETSQDDYSTSHDLNIYINEDHWGQTKGSYMKTNIKKQVDNIAGCNEEREVIKLLKIWKKRHDKDYKSFVIELITICAMEGFTTGEGLWGRLKHTMEFIRDHVADDSFHLYDPGNSNNDVIAAMDKHLRISLKNDMTNMLNNIETNDAYLPIYFPVNEKYCVKTENGFGNKPGREGYSVPTSPQRYGCK